MLPYRLAGSPVAASPYARYLACRHLWRATDLAAVAVNDNDINAYRSTVNFSAEPVLPQQAQGRTLRLVHTGGRL